jgi:hypothetical protein
MGSTDPLSSVKLVDCLEIQYFIITDKRNDFKDYFSPNENIPFYLDFYYKMIQIMNDAIGFALPRNGFTSKGNSHKIAICCESKTVLYSKE